MICKEGNLSLIWHAVSEKEIFSSLQSTPEGLSFADVQGRLQKFGQNQIESLPQKGIFELIIRQLKSPLVYLLLLSAVLTSLLGHTLDTSVILIVVSLNTLIGFFQEYKAEKSILALRQLAVPKAKVLREENEHLIENYKVVPGDIVILEEGYKIPADIRLLESTNLKINESILTGESIPQAKTIETMTPQIPLADRLNMAYAGTLVVFGRGKGIVVQTGNKTELGKITKEVVETSEPETYLEKKMREFSKLILYVAVAIAVFIIILGIGKGLNIVSMILVGVAMMVSVIPEGLPAVITVALASSVIRLSKLNTIIKRLAAIETLGAVTTILTDKTGTLTSGQMNIRRIFTPPYNFDVSGEGYQPEGDFSLFEKKTNVNLYPQLKLLLTLGTLCNNANLIEKENGWEILGDPTEGSLLVAAEKAKIFKEEIGNKFLRLDEIPFSTDKLYMATLHQTSDSKEKLIVVKGAVEQILKMSSFYEEGGRVRRLNLDNEEVLLRQSHRYANSALRVLAIAYKKAKGNLESLRHNELSDLTFVGFAGMIDPPSAFAIKSVNLARQAGISVIMVTGDNELTALKVAQQVGIYDQKTTVDKLKVISGEKLTQINDLTLRTVVREVAVFARVSPHDKLRIVRALQRNGQIVAVTGDGVNDAPALKTADVGVAMGRRGNDVSREASELILRDDNFSNIILAISEGRTVSQNIKRVIFFLLSTNAGEALILIVAMLLGLPLPLTAVQILWINLITDGLNTVPLVFEKSHIEVLKFPPRTPKEPILNQILKDRIGLVAFVMAAVTIPLFWTNLSGDGSLKTAQSFAFVLMGILQIFNVFNARSFKLSIFKTPFFSNPALLLSILGSIILTVATVSFLPLQLLFNTTSLPLNQWLIILLVSLTIILAVEIEKWWRRKTKVSY